MGAVPKKKPSKTRARQRHSAWVKSQLDAQHTNFVDCKECGAKRLPHRACPKCGKYRGELVVEPKAKVKKVS